MKMEALLFAGVAAFFLVTDIVYAWSAQEPAGTAALTVSCVMLSLLSFFCAMNHRRRGARPEDRKESEIAERSGRLDFFPPQSVHPVVTALGTWLAALGIVYGLWIFVLGIGLLAGGVFGMVFQFAGREDDAESD